MSTMSPDFAEAMGEDAEKMHADMAATEKLLTMHMIFTLADAESDIERTAAEALEKSLENLMARPEKALDVITILTALVAHMRVGETYASFFEAAGIKVNPIVNDKTGERR